MVAPLYATRWRPAAFERRLRPREEEWSGLAAFRAAALPPQSCSGGGIGGGRRGPLRSCLVHPLVVEAVRALDALFGAGDVLLLQLLEVRHAGHDVVALGGMAGLRLLEPPLRLLLVTHQLLHRVPGRVGTGVRGEERDEDELVAELAQLLEGERV